MFIGKHFPKKLSSLIYAVDNCGKSTLGGLLCSLPHLILVILILLHYLLLACRILANAR